MGTFHLKFGFQKKLMEFVIEWEFDLDGGGGFFIDDEFWGIVA